MTSSDKQQILRRLPGVDHLLELAGKQDQFKAIPRNIILEAARNALDAIRKKVMTGDAPKFQMT